MSNQLNKRLHIASDAVQEATKLYDALQNLKTLNAEYVAMADPFTDGDFTSSGFPYLDAYTIGSLLSIVTSAIDTTVTDAGNGNFNRDILLKVRS